jgi:plasmid stabilization system protein ParE
VYEVIVTERALGDIENIRNYICDNLNNSPAAEKFLDLFASRMPLLEDSPAKFPRVSDVYLRSLGIRWLPLESYVAFYSVGEEEKRVNVWRVLFAKSRWQNLLRDIEVTIAL